LQLNSVKVLCPSPIKGGRDHHDKNSDKPAKETKSYRSINLLSILTQIKKKLFNKRLKKNHRRR